MVMLKVIENVNESSLAHVVVNGSGPTYQVAGGWTVRPPIIQSDLMSQASREYAKDSVNSTSELSREFDSGEMAWILLCTAITWLMLPGVGFFYNGTAPKKSSLVLLITCLWSCAVISIQWYLIGYTLVLSKTGGPFIGNLDHVLLRNINGAPALSNPKIPALLQGVWYCLFAAITPTIIIGGIVERARLMPSVLFIFLWSTFVFDPLAYWAWNPKGWIFGMGALDYGGSTAVHIATGAAALAYALVLGKRKDPRDKPPHNMAHVILGTSFIWLGWLVANAGSGLKPNLRATLVFVTTNLSGSVGGVVWTLMEYRKEHKFSAFGFCCWVLCGLVVITPASGYVSPSSAVAFGAAGAIVCNIALGIKTCLRIDDTFDVFAVHGIGGILGNLLTGVFAQKEIAALDGLEIDGGWVDGHWAQVPYQIVDTLAGGLWSFCITLIIVGVLNRIPALRLRVDPEVEQVGIDDGELGEPMYLFVDELDEQLQALTASAFKINGPDGEQRETLASHSRDMEMSRITHPSPL